MRVCVIGNSHAAALKSGLNGRDGESAGLRVTFFASRGQTLGRLALVDGVLSPPGGRLAQNLRFTSGGQDSIDPSHYDAFVLCGLGFGLRYELLGPTAYSASFVHDYCHAQWKGSVCHELHGLLRNVTSAPVLICPEPYLSETAKRSSKAAAASHTSPGHLPRALQASGAVFHGDTAVLVQPASTVVGEIFTAAAFAQNSIRLAVKAEEDHQAHGQRDVAHMNGRYGALLWRSIEGRLGAGARPRAELLPE